MTTRRWMAGEGVLGAALAAAVLAGGCGGGDLQGEPSTRGLTASPSTVVTSVTLSGTEQFDDYRDYGRFAIRKDASGNAGKQHSMDGATTNNNYLAMMDATVEIY